MNPCSYFLLENVQVLTTKIHYYGPVDHFIVDCGTKILTWQRPVKKNKMISKISWFKNEMEDNEVLIIVKSMNVIYSQCCYFCC